jgi:hypothetical protein
MENNLNADQLTKWLTFGANFGVLIGIILLVVELGQNREMMRAQTRSDIAAVAIGHYDSIATNRDLADIMRRARIGEDLDETETMRYLFVSLATFRHFENVHYQYRLGLFDEEEFTGELQGFSNLLKGSVGLTRVWCRFRTFTSQDFRAEVDAIYGDRDCD